MDQEIWIAIISGFFLAVVAPFMTKLAERVFGKKRDPRGPIKTSRGPILLQVVGGGAIGVLLGYFVVSPFIISPCPPFTPARLEITSPAPGSSVPRLVAVEGTACHIPKDEELWLFVLPEGITAYYPQPGPASVTSDGRWTASAYVGLDDPVDVGRGFVLIAALADQAGSAAIREYFAQAPTQGQPGLEPLPGGIRLIVQIRVVRR